MKTAALVVSPSLKNNQIFDPNCPYAFDSVMSGYILMREKFAAHGVDLATHDIHSPEEADYVIYMSVPNTLPALKDKHKSFVILGEPEVVRRRDWNPKTHAHFAKVFSFSDDHVDGRTHIKLNLSRSFSDDVPTDREEKIHFCALIAGNKFSRHPKELYSARRRLIRWFETHHPEQFDLFGGGWDQKHFRGVLRPFNRVPFMKRCFAPHYPSYRGKAGSKFDLLRTYKFSITFENAFGFPGYITGDKIFESLQAGCIPVYLGAPNITDYVPRECFIDMRQFNNFDELYAYMQGMSAQEHQHYLDHIQRFMRTQKYGPYSAEYFSDVMLQHVLGVAPHAAKKV